MSSQRPACFLLSAMLALAFPGAALAEPVIELKFGDFFQRPVGPRGLELSSALRKADGRTVKIVGYAVTQENALPGRFLLTPRPVRMSEHADGDADDLPPNTLTVLLDDSQRSRMVAHQAGLLSLVGRLEIGRQEDAGSGRVSWIRLRLAPDALAAEPLSAKADTPPHAH